MSDGPADALRRLADPVTRPRELLEHVKYPTELVEQALAGAFLPTDVILQVTDGLSGPLRDQAKAFEEVSQAFAHIASLLAQQADLLEKAGSAIRQPTDALEVRRRRGQVVLLRDGTRTGQHAAPHGVGGSAHEVTEPAGRVA